MNALVPMALLRQAAARAADDGPPSEAAAPTGVAVWQDLWQSRYGTIRLEIIDGVCHVNGDRVDPAVPSRTHTQG